MTPRLRTAATIGTVLGLAIAGLPVLGTTASAIEVPPTSEPYFFQTSGPRAGLGIGDYYTSMTGAPPRDASGPVRPPDPHRGSCIVGDLPVVLVELYDPELHDAGPNVLADDEVRGPEDSAWFTLVAPDGTQLQQTEYDNDSTDSSWVTFHSFDPDLSGGCGDYLLRVETGNGPSETAASRPGQRRLARRREQR